MIVVKTITVTLRLDGEIDETEQGVIVDNLVDGILREREARTAGFAKVREVSAGFVEGVKREARVVDDAPAGEADAPA